MFDSSEQILGGLFQTSYIFQIPTSILGGLSLMLYGPDEPNILFSLIPIIVYSNVQTDKSSILTDNKGKAGIYMWIHNESGKRYVGSAVDLEKRMSCYFSSAYLERFKSMYICNALRLHGYSAFSLSILVYVDISPNLSKDDVRKLILNHEQYYLDLIFSLDESNTYNILMVAGSPLGYKHTEETKQK